MCHFEDESTRTVRVFMTLVPPRWGLGEARSASALSPYFHLLWDSRRAAGTDFFLPRTCLPCQNSLN